MQLNTNINISATNEAKATIERKLLGLRLASAVELQDLSQLQAAIAACAQRETNRLTAKVGDAAPVTVSIKARAAQLAQRQIQVVEMANAGTTELKLLQRPQESPAPSNPPKA